MSTATLKIFLVHGDPKRLRTVELSNWTGKAVSGPRSEFDKVLAREESQHSGVYFLTGVDPDTGKSAIYIGQGECIRDRVKVHSNKDFWNAVTFFIAQDESLTRAHALYLEGRLIDIARSAERAEVKNEQGSGSRLPESDRADMEVFLSKMQQVLPVVGIESFLPKVPARDEEEGQQQILYCSIKGLVARGYLTPNGMVVLKGSQAVLEERASARNYPTVLSQRKELIAEGTLVAEQSNFVFCKDVEFSSPSAAAAVIHGGSANGLVAWKNSEGVSIKDMQEP